MNKHKMFKSQMGSSKYEFEGSIDEDIANRLQEVEKRKQYVRNEVFRIFKEIGPEHAEKEVIELFVGLKRKEIIISPEGFKDNPVNTTPEEGKG